MEIALDLAQASAAASIIVHGVLHLITREIMNTVRVPRRVQQHRQHGLRRPDVGPFTRKIQSNAYLVIDVGSYNKIKSNQIQVLSAMTSIEGDAVEFTGGERHRLDTIVFATWYRSTEKKWLKSDDGGLIGDDGMASGRSPKGENRLYRMGLAGRGIYGSGTDNEFIAEDISRQLRQGSGDDDGDGI
uniref:indole-3-pyruvate monooxygenase n=1 Tax=Aegilops tauschii TaxID=37682 RepID=M8AWP4_AEGTA